MPHLLSNVRILDLSRMLAGPFGSMLLGDLGAEIIKIEEPAGDFTRTPAQYHMGGIGAYFLAINRNKKSIVIDLTTPQGREVLAAWRATWTVTRDFVDATLNRAAAQETSP